MPNTLSPTAEDFLIQTLNARMSNKGVREETIDGRRYLIAPVRMIVADSVLAGSKGPLLYPSQEIAATHKDWEGYPITVNHPFQDGWPISARSPGVWEKWGIGFIRSPKITPHLDAEACIDIEKTRQIEPRILTNLRQNKKMELSTGLFTKNLPAPYGSRAPNGRPYAEIATRYRPDHLAILPDVAGACSLADGCGVLVNRASSHRTLIDVLKDSGWITSNAEGWITTKEGQHVFIGAGGSFHPKGPGSKPVGKASGAGTSKSLEGKAKKPEPVKQGLPNEGDQLRNVTPDEGIHITPIENIKSIASTGLVPQTPHSHDGEFKAVYFSDGMLKKGHEEAIETLHKNDIVLKTVIPKGHNAYDDPEVRDLLGTGTNGNKNIGPGKSGFYTTAGIGPENIHVVHKDGSRKSTPLLEWVNSPEGKKHLGEVDQHFGIDDVLTNAQGWVTTKTGQHIFIGAGGTVHPGGPKSKSVVGGGKSSSTSDDYDTPSASLSKSIADSGKGKSLDHKLDLGNKVTQTDVDASHRSYLTAVSQHGPGHEVAKAALKNYNTKQKALNKQAADDVASAKAALDAKLKSSPDLSKVNELQAKLDSIKKQSDALKAQKARSPFQSDHPHAEAAKHHFAEAAKHLKNMYNDPNAAKLARHHAKMGELYERRLVQLRFSQRQQGN